MIRPNFLPFNWQIAWNSNLHSYFQIAQPTPASKGVEWMVSGCFDLLAQRCGQAVDGLYAVIQHVGDGSEL